MPSLEVSGLKGSLHFEFRTRSAQADVGSVSSQWIPGTWNRQPRRFVIAFGVRRPAKMRQMSRPTDAGCSEAARTFARRRHRYRQIDPAGTCSRSRSRSSTLVGRRGSNTGAGR